MKQSVIVALSFLGLVFAQHAPSTLPKVKFTDTRLDNGLRVIISEDHYAPVYAICVAYKVGSKDERPGRTGFAHLFEHMMFKGTENVGVGELDFLIYTNGGNSNGTTNTDRTSYYEVLPKNQLDLGLYLEADRMHALAITQENLENQRQAVKEERRQSVDNQAYGQTSEKLEELVYDNFAYHHPVVGSMADLDAASVDDVKQFFKTYYAPNNAVLALVGDLDTKETLAKVKKYFGSDSAPRRRPRRWTWRKRPKRRNGAPCCRIRWRACRASISPIAFRRPAIRIRARWAWRRRFWAAAVAAAGGRRRGREQLAPLQSAGERERSRGQVSANAPTGAPDRACSASPPPSGRARPAGSRRADRRRDRKLYAAAGQRSGIEARSHGAAAQRGEPR